MSGRTLPTAASHGPWVPVRGLWRPMVRGVWLVARRRPLHLLAALVLMAIPGALFGIQVVAQRDLFARGLALATGGPLRLFVAAAAAYLAVWLGISLFNTARGVLHVLISNGLQSAIAEADLTQAARLRLDAPLDPAFHDLLGRVQRAAMRDAGDNPLVKVLNLARYTAQAAGMAAGLYVLDPTLAVAAILAALPSLLAGVSETVWQRALALDQSRRQNRVAYLAQLLTSRSAAAEIRAFGLADHLLARWRGLLRELQAERWALEVRVRPLATAIYVVADGLLGYAFGLLWALWLVARGDLSVAAFAACAAALLTFRSNLEILLVGIGLTHGQTLELADVFGFLDAPLNESFDRGARPFSTPLRAGISVEDLSYQYPGAAVATLRGVRLHLRAGEKVALVGAKGVGTQWIRARRIRSIRVALPVIA